MRSSRPPAKSSPLSPRDTRQSGANAANGSVSSRPGPSPSSVRHGQKPSINVSGDAPMPSSPLAATTPLTSPTLSRNGQSPQSPPLSASVLSNPSALSNPSTWRPEQESPGPTALLVPTDRPLEDLEQWLPSQSRLRVEKEVVLSGYALYGIRSWYVGSNRASPPTTHNRRSLTHRYLSRTHGAFTIAASTGKPSDKVGVIDPGCQASGYPPDRSVLTPPDPLLPTRTRRAPLAAGRPS